MNAVEMAAKATSPLRRIPAAVSRKKYSIRSAAVPVHPSCLVPDDLALVELDHPACAWRPRSLVVGGHDHRRPDLVDLVQEPMMSTHVSGSRLPVGSSARSTSGRLTKARAIETRCCSPPESSSG